MLKMLVVDDEADVCDFVKNFFKERNFEVFIAHDGKEALAIVESSRPEIVLLDIRMPVMDGMDALKAIHRVSSRTKIVMITAVNDEDKAKAAKHYGAVDYITKPLLLEQLERTVLRIAEQITMGS